LEQVLTRLENEYEERERGSHPKNRQRLRQAIILRLGFSAVTSRPHF